MEQALRLAADILGVSAGLLCQVEEGTCTVRHAYPADQITEGSSFSLDAPYASLALPEGEVATPEDGSAHPCAEMVGRPACIGTPIEMEGQRYGTLDFFGEKEAFTERDATLVRLMGEWAGNVLNQQKAQERLLASQEALMSVLDSSMDGILVLRAARNDQGGIEDLICLLVNAKAEELLGVSGEQVHGMSLLEAMPDSHISRLFNQFVKVIEMEDSLHKLLHEELQVGGSFQLTAAKLNDGLVVTFHEITEHHRAKKALRESRELLSSVLDSSADGIMALRPLRDEEDHIEDFEWLLANPQAEALIGKTSLELLDRRLTDELPDLKKAGLVEAFAQVIKSGESYSNELYLEGERIQGWFRVTATRFSRGLAVTLHNVTASKEAEQALRRSEERYRLLAENATDLITRVHPEHGYTYVSPASREVLGYGPKELAEQFSLESVHPEDRERVREAIEQLSHTEEPVRIAYRYQHKDGHYVWLETATRSVRSNNKATGSAKEIIGVTRDVTSRIQAEQALKHSNEQLKQRNQALQDFAYVASHDLQEPLRKVRAFAGLLEDEYAETLDEMGVRYIERMRSAAERMSGLITDLLEFSRVTTQEASYETVDLNEVLSDVYADLEIAIVEAEATIDVGALPTLQANETQMRQLFQNLISNAIKFARPEEPPVVQVRSQVVERAGSTPAYCRISVSDNGIGIDEEYLDRIFSPFRRLHGRDEFEGSGMGLAICQRIAGRHGGHITATSASGPGSTFIVTLPLKQGSDRIGDVPSPSDLESLMPASEKEQEEA